MATQITPENIHERLAQGLLGASQPLWSDTMPHVVVGATASGKSLRVAPLQVVGGDTGHKPDHECNGFPVWDHTYTEHEMQDGSPLRRDVERLARWSPQRGAYLLNGRALRVGHARYHRNYAD